MEKDKLIIETVKSLGFDKVVPEVYRDMLQPAAQQVGNGLATIAKAVKISLAPLEVGIWGYEQIKEWLSLRVTSIHADRKTKKIETPPLPIAGPLILQLFFAKDVPELKELYASLLSSAMDPSNTSTHPSFVSIIQQLTPDEAKILRHVAHIDSDWPSLSYDSSAEENSHQSVNLKFKDWCEEASVDHLNRSDVYLDNLIRLNIFRYTAGSEAELIPEGNDRYGDYEASVSNIEYEFIELTAFGRLFFNACIEKKNPNN